LEVCHSSGGGRRGRNEEEKRKSRTSPLFSDPVPPCGGYFLKITLNVESSQYDISIIDGAEVLSPPLKSLSYPSDKALVNIYKRFGLIKEKPSTFKR
jgi:hypothetical protein